MDFELLLKLIGYFPDYLSALSHTLLRFFGTTFVETVVSKRQFTQKVEGVSSLMGHERAPFTCIELLMRPHFLTSLFCFFVL